MKRIILIHLNCLYKRFQFQKLIMQNIHKAILENWDLTHFDNFEIFRRELLIYNKLIFCLFFQGYNCQIHK
ncbi:unnamed protein product [Paramecium primaurelia]|uniref:Uncharacterized protein n=1 Tax=Paramecium primaurelia TaxID=5886 RepID=A0A8S1PSI1_PARPR|nr:unnamed protein product [Paramecium primaurelia]